MRFWSQSGAMVGLLAWGGLASLGCEAQVGDEYTGDVMLELRGHVVAAGTESNDWVPAVAFLGIGTPGGADDFGDAVKVQIVDGKVEGIFPSDFTLKLAGPPPMSPKQHGIAMGYVVLVPRDHVQSFELPVSTTTTFGPANSEAGTSDVEEEIDIDIDELDEVEHRKYCMITGECLERDYTCVREPCEVISEQGDPEHPSTLSSGFGISACLPDVCYSQQADCADSASCYRQSYRCDVSAPGAEHDEDSVKICTKTAERGDTSIKLFDEYLRVAANLLVIYVSSDSSIGSRVLDFEGLEDIKAGYNLIELPAAASSEAFLDFASCEFDARVQALAEFNEANGTMYTYEDAELDSDAVWRRFAELTRKSCPTYRLIADPAAVPLDLNLDQAP